MNGKVTDLKGTIVFTGGGTGGHIYPNLALIPEFQKRGYGAAYIGGDGETMEKKLAEENGIPYYGIPVIKLIRSMDKESLINNLKIPVKLNNSVEKARELLKKLSPSAVFSKGGFVSLPVVIAARELEIPCFAHESDLTLGLANKLARLYGAKILKANPDSDFSGELVGMPLRESLFKVKKSEAREKLKIETAKKVLLIVGGSSGAKFINDEVKKNLDELTKKYFVIHIIGRQAEENGGAKKKSAGNANSSYMRLDYADNIADYYAASDIVVSRAGATAVYELSALKKRVLFIPLPKGVSRGDQIDNAELAKKFGANVLLQNESFSDNFLGAIEKAKQNPPMSPVSYDANGKIADIVCDSIRRGVKCKNKKLSQNGSL